VSRGEYPVIRPLIPMGAASVAPSADFPSSSICCSAAPSTPRQCWIRKLPRSYFKEALFERNLAGLDVGEDLLQLRQRRLKVFGGRLMPIFLAIDGH